MAAGTLSDVVDERLLENGTPDGRIVRRAIPADGPKLPDPETPARLLVDGMAVTHSSPLPEEASSAFQSLEPSRLDGV